MVCLTLLDNNRKRIFSLDRVINLKVSDTTFNYPADFVAIEYFQNYFGIIAGMEQKVENIKIRTYAELPGYLRSLPMHHSQRELESKDGYTDFSLRLVPTFDFIQELLLHRDQLEVLEPKTLRDEISILIARMERLYTSE